MNNLTRNAKLREDENLCVLTICQRHKIGLTEKQQTVILRYITPRSTAVAMYYCDYPKVVTKFSNSGLTQPLKLQPTLRKSEMIVVSKQLHNRNE